MSRVLARPNSAGKGAKELKHLFTPFPEGLPLTALTVKDTRDQYALVLGNVINEVVVQWELSYTRGNQTTHLPHQRILAQHGEQIVKAPKKLFRTVNSAMLRESIPDRIDTALSTLGKAVRSHFRLALLICAAARALPRPIASRK